MADASNAVLLLKFKCTCNKAQHSVNLTINNSQTVLTSLISKNDIPGVLYNRKHCGLLRSLLNTDGNICVDTTMAAPMLLV